eukprot:3746541-Pyramimonas_sp.AAC.1
MRGACPICNTLDLKGTVGFRHISVQVFSVFSIVSGGTTSSRCIIPHAVLSRTLDTCKSDHTMSKTTGKSKEVIRSPCMLPDCKLFGAPVIVSRASPWRPRALAPAICGVTG